MLKKAMRPLLPALHCCCRLFVLGVIVLNPMQGRTAAAADQGAATGKITGTVLASDDNRPLAEAGVEGRPADGPAVFGLTNAEGFFVLEVPAGTYELRVTYPNHETAHLRAVVVKAGAAIHKSISLGPAPVEIEAMRVVAKPKGDIELVQLMKRRSAANIMDNISAESISKIPESDVAGILSRMPGVTINDGKYMQARGMPKRYNRTLFNGSTLPTTKPNEKLVPLDLFPTGVVESINVSKSYSPDLPANFSGGLAQIFTRSIPEKFVMKFSAQGSYNTETTGEDFLTYSGGDRDWLGYDDGTRDKPGIIPDAKLVRQGRFGDDGYGPLELERFGESFKNIWKTYTKTAAPDMDYSLLLGNRFNQAGFLMYVKYKNENRTRDNEKNFIYSSQGGQGELKRDNAYEFERSTNKVLVNGMLNGGIEFTPDHHLYLNNFYIHTGTDEVSFYEGYNSDIGGDIRNTRLRFIEEEIYSGQLVGEHNFYWIVDHSIDWHYSYSTASMWEPDTREYLYEFNPSVEEFQFADESQSGSHMWTRQEEDIHDLAFDWTLNFDVWSGLSSKFKFGTAYMERDREFWHRRFRFMPRDASKIDMADPVDRILDPHNINPYEFEIQETTRTTDTYDATQQVSSWYFLLDLPLTSLVKISGGVRYESSEIDLKSFDLFNPDNTIGTKLHTRDWFPAVNLTWTIRDDMFLRLGYSETVSRPEFHELAPFEFTDVRGGRVVKGNPDLKIAEIENWDVRWEWFINDNDLVALSLFYKDFTNAIEKTIQPTIELRSSFVNADDAWLYGVEFELRKNLEFLSPWLRYWNVSGNYIYADSEAEISPRPGFVPTSLKRPMVGQAEHTYNITLEYSNPEWGFTGRLLFQHISDRINEVGGLGLPDIVLEDSSRFDVVLLKRFGESLELKMVAENITNQGTEYTQGGRVFYRWQEGVTWKFKFSYSW